MYSQISRPFQATTTLSVSKSLQSTNVSVLVQVLKKWQPTSFLLLVASTWSLPGIHFWCPYLPVFTFTHIPKSQIPYAFFEFQYITAMTVMCPPHPLWICYEETLLKRRELKHGNMYPTSRQCRVHGGFFPGVHLFPRKAISPERNAVPTAVIWLLKRTAT